MGDLTDMRPVTVELVTKSGGNSIGDTDNPVITTLQDGDGNTANVDDGSGSIQTISFEHHKIHTALSYERHITSVNLPVATMNVAFKTAAGTNAAHMLFGFSSNDEILFEVGEGVTWTQGSGTALDFFNNNRNLNISSTVILEDVNQATFTASDQVIKNVTGLAGGAIIEAQYTYNAGLGAATVAETRQAGHEWYLKPDTTYLVRMTATDDNCKMTIDLHWYENEPIN